MVNTCVWRVGDVGVGGERGRVLHGEVERVADRHGLEEDRVSLVVEPERRVGAVGPGGLRGRARGQTVAHARDGLNDPRVEGVQDGVGEVYEVPMEARLRLVLYRWCL